MQQDVIKLLRRFIIHRTDAYAVMTRNDYQQRDNYYDREFEVIDDALLTRHLNGEVTIAVFPTDVETQTVKWCCWDIDSKDPIDTQRVFAVCARYGFNPVLEKSGRPHGLHVWNFFDNPKPLGEIKRIRTSCALRGIDFFPERDVVVDDYYYELPIKLPLGFHRKEKVWSKFIDPIEHKEISFATALRSAGYLQ